jgi:hypothetical protein
MDIDNKTNPAYRYARWAGNPKGHPQHPELCVEEVWPTNGSWIPHQCARKRGHGPDGLYCKQHGKKMEARNADK